MHSRLFRLACIAVLAFVVGLIAACGGGQHHPATLSTFAPVSGHPCVLSTYYMQCATQAPGQELPRSFKPTISSGWGLDFAWGGPPGSIAQSGGVKFAISYLSNSSKDWNYTQLHDYINRHIAVGFVWETSATRALDGYGAGQSDARSANAELNRYGISGLPIYFAVDSDLSASSVASYFWGVQSVLGRYRTGVYGGYRVVSGLLSGGEVGMAWQTLAWSYGNRDWRACVFQYSIEQWWNGYNVDYNSVSCANNALYPTAPPIDARSYNIGYRLGYATGRSLPYQRGYEVTHHATPSNNHDFNLGFNAGWNKGWHYSANAGYSAGKNAPRFPKTWNGSWKLGFDTGWATGLGNPYYGYFDLWHWAFGYPSSNSAYNSGWVVGKPTGYNNEFNKGYTA